MKNTNNSSQNGIQESQLMRLFENQLEDIYWAEKALTEALPKMEKKATSDELRDAIENHLEETHHQINRLEEVFELIGKKVSAKKCEAMAGLIKEANEIMGQCEDGFMCDAGIIFAGQKVEHYEIATYGTLRQFALTLGLSDVADLLEKTLNEEKTANEKFTEIAMNSVNIEAAKTV